MRKILISIIGFGLGVFMLFNSIGAFYRFLHGYPKLAPYESMASSIITLLVGIVLVIWTIFLIKRKREN